MKLPLGLCISDCLSLQYKQYIDHRVQPYASVAFLHKD